jgi:hypothetical protein
MYGKLWLLAVLGLTVALNGCLASWGRLSRSPDVTETFSEHRFIEGYNYYFRGFDAEPEALLGLDRAYSLEKSSWKPVDPKVHSLEKMVDAMKFHLCEHKGVYPYSADGKRELAGYSVLNPDGETIGILYSCFDWFPVKMLDENRVSIFFHKESKRLGNYRDLY